MAFTDPSLHLLVRNNATLFDVALSLAHRSEKRDFVGSITIIDVVWQSVDRMKDLLFNAHGPRLTEFAPTRNMAMKRNKVRLSGTPRLAGETPALPKLGNELLVRNGGLSPALCYDRQIFQVFQQFFVV